MDMYVSVLLFPFSSFRILPLNAQKTLYFFHPSLCADLAVHYMTQTLLPFTFLNSTFSSLPLSMLFFLLESVLQREKAVFFKEKFSFFCLPCPSQLQTALSVLKQKLISNIHKFYKQSSHLIGWSDLKLEEISWWQSLLWYSQEKVELNGNFGEIKTFIHKWHLIFDHRILNLIFQSYCCYSPSIAPGHLWLY